MNHVSRAGFSKLTIRWTIGNVRHRGFEMLRLSIVSAYNLFGSEADYVVCVNSVAVGEAQRRVGLLPAQVTWRGITLDDIPEWLSRHVDDKLAEGTGWKLAPFRLAPDHHVLALDNDCILWRIPDGLNRWLESSDGVLIAEDVQRCLGCFDTLCPPGAYNSGIRGIAPGAQFESCLRAALNEVARASDGSCLTSEVDEQGLQVAAAFRTHPVFLVRKTEVSICSPFWPRSTEFGSCGAHFVGMNARHTPWHYFDRPADVWLDEHWERHRRRLYGMAGAPVSEAA